MSSLSPLLSRFPAAVLPGNVLAALAAAAAWGGGDFAGGMGVKAVGGETRRAVGFVVVAHALSLAVMLPLLLLLHAPFPRGAALGWGVGGGVAAGLSIVAFYMALARGTMGPSAALSGVLAAAIPAVVSSRVEGTPHTLKLAGFALAAVAIWIVASSPGGGEGSRRTTVLALVGGFGFGIYFTALRFANPLGVLEPIALARAGSIVACGLLLLLLGGRGGERAPALRGRLLGWIGAVALLDTGGNLLYTWSTRLGRLDVAAVLASLYPASTILLAAWRLHERPARKQWAGIGLALIAVVLITI